MSTAISNIVKPTQPTYSASGGAIIPGGGASLMYTPPAQTALTNAMNGTPAPTVAPTSTNITRTSTQPNYSPLGGAIIPQNGSTGIPAYVAPISSAAAPITDPQVLANQTKQANAGKPGYNVFGDPVAGTPNAGGGADITQPGGPGGMVASSNGIASNTNIGTNPTSQPTAVTNAGALANQATTAQTNPLNDPNNPLVANLANWQKQYTDLYNKMQASNTAIGSSGETLPVVMGQENLLQQQYAKQLDSLSNQINAAQTSLGQANTAYANQTQAQNAVTTQTQPSNQTQQVGQGTTVLGANGQPIVTTPNTATPGTALYYPTPTTYTPTGQVNPTSGTSPTAYSVQNGDTLSSIAAKQGVSLAALEAANSQISNFNQIAAGQQINLPGGTGGSVGSTQIGSPYAAGTVAGQQAAGQNVVAMKTAYQQATNIHTQISDLLKTNPTLNSSPLSAGNAIKQWAQSTQAPTGPYVNLLNDLQEYANTIAPVLGVTSGNTTDAKQAIANAMVPTLASGGTIESALTNLEITAAGKINKAQEVGQNPNISITAPSSTMSGSTPSGASSIGGNMFGSFF